MKKRAIALFISVTFLGNICFGYYEQDRSAPDKDPAVLPRPQSPWITPARLKPVDPEIPVIPGQVDIAKDGDNYSIDIPANLSEKQRQIIENWLLNIINGKDRSNSYLKAAAIDALGKIGRGDAAVQVLISIASDKNNSNCLKAITALGNIALRNSPAAAACITALARIASNTASSSNIRSAALAAIVNIGSSCGKDVAKICVAVLQGIALNSRNPSDMRSAALAAIGNIGINNKNITDVCVSILKDIASNRRNPENVRLEALRAIGNIGAGNNNASIKCADILAAIASNKNNSETLRANALAAIGRIGAGSSNVADKCLDILQGILSDKSNSDNIRSSALSAVYSIGVLNTAMQDRCFEIFKNVLADKSNSENILASALVVIRNIGAFSNNFTDKCLSILQGIVSNSGYSTYIRSFAMYSIVFMAGKNAGAADKCFSALKDIATDNNIPDSIRFSVINTLSTMGAYNPAVADACIDILKSIALDAGNSDALRSGAVQALIKIGLYNDSAAGKCIDTLKEIAMTDGIPDSVRLTALNVLETIGGMNQHVTGLVRTAENYIINAAVGAKNALTSIVENWLAGIVNNIGSTDSAWKLFAVKTLASIGTGEKAFDALAAIAADKNNSDEIRLAAIGGISKIALASTVLDDKCLEALKNIALGKSNSDKVRLAALDVVHSIAAQNPASLNNVIEILKQISLDGSNSVTILENVRTTVLYIGTHNKDFVGKALEILKNMALDNSNTDLEFRTNVVYTITSLNLWMTQNSDTMASCINAFKDIGSNAGVPEDIRSAALHALGILAGFFPNEADKYLGALKDIVTDNSVPENIRLSALNALGDTGASTFVKDVADKCFNILKDIASNKTFSTNILSGALNAMSAICAKNTDMVADFATLMKAIISDNTNSVAYRLNALQNMLKAFSAAGIKPDNETIKLCSTLLQDKSLDDNSRLQYARSLALAMGYDFGKVFGELCNTNPQIAATLFKNGFGFGSGDEARYIVQAIFVPKNLTPQQINLLFSAKDGDGNYILSDRNLLDFFTQWTNQMGGTAPWDGNAMLAFVNCPRAQALFSSLWGSLDVKMQNQFLLSLINVVQNGSSSYRSAAVNLLFNNNALLGIDRSIAYLLAAGPLTQSAWKQIVLNSNYNINTRAAALSQITDKDFLYSYVFSIGTDGQPHMKSGLTNVEFAGIVRTGLTSTWYSTLGSKDERKNYINMILAYDTTDEKKYIGWNGSNYMQNSLCAGSNDPNSFVCVDFSVQFMVNNIGLTGNGDVTVNTTPDQFEGNGYSTPALNYGIPTFLVSLPSEGHAINAVFIGNNINDPAQLTDSSNWMLVEPQANYDDTDLLSFGTRSVQIILQGQFIGHGGVNTGSITKSVTFQVTNGKTGVGTVRP